MMTIRDFVIKACRKLYCKASGKKFDSPVCDMDRQSSNDKIYNLLTSSKPCMIARFGTTESAILCNLNLTPITADCTMNSGRVLMQRKHRRMLRKLRVLAIGKDNKVL